MQALSMAATKIATECPSAGGARTKTNARREIRRQKFLGQSAGAAFHDVVRPLATIKWVAAPGSQRLAKPDCDQLDAVLAVFKAWPVEPKGCGTACSTASLDGVCARRHRSRQVGTKKRP
jgi:hypothetical protein